MRTLLVGAAFAAIASAHAQTTLGSYTFNDAQFGDKLIESDGGTGSAANWLNTTNADPGNPAYLTGVNFETGVANIGLFAMGDYTIFYNTPIVNGVGADLAVVVARYSADDVLLSVSQDGSNFTSANLYAASTGIFSGETRNYFYVGNGPFIAELFVHEIDLTEFGLNLGDSISAVNVVGSPELDLIRVAGLQAVPEPATMLGLGAGLAMLIRRRRR